MLKKKVLSHLCLCHEVLFLFLTLNSFNVLSLKVIDRFGVDCLCNVRDNDLVSFIFMYLSSFSNNIC